MKSFFELTSAKLEGNEPIKIGNVYIGKYHKTILVIQRVTETMISAVTISESLQIFPSNFYPCALLAYYDLVVST